jgi:tRNA threonylcarbamoyladenosine biosynthesis protein TsaB
MNNILCIETGTDTCSVALASRGELVALRESHGERDHAARVAVYTTEVLSEAGFSMADLSAVAVSRGPGSYTGLRIGVSFAKGVCYGLGVPLIGVGSLDSLCVLAAEGILPLASADGTPEPHIPSGFSPKLYVPMIDARRMEVFCQVFDSAGSPVTQPEALIIDEESFAEYRSREVYIFGTGAEKCREALPWAHFLDVNPSARGMIALANRAFERGESEDTAYFEPFYLKDFIITTPKKKVL